MELELGGGYAGDDLKVRSGYRWLNGSPLAVAGCLRCSDVSFSHLELICPRLLRLFMYLSGLLPFLKIKTHFSSYPNVLRY